MGFSGGSVVKNPPANAGDSGDVVLIPGSGRSPGEGNGNPLQYSFLRNPMDRGAWRATVHGVAKESDMTEHEQDRQNPVLLSSRKQETSEGDWQRVRAVEGQKDQIPAGQRHRRAWGNSEPGCPLACNHAVLGDSGFYLPW